MKYMKRVSAELEAVGGGPEEEELIVQGVRFAFRVHQVKKRNKIFSFKYYAVNFERFHFADLGCRVFFFLFPAQFAGGFDVETMRGFQELREKARSCHIQCQNQQQHKFVCRSTPC